MPRKLWKRNGFRSGFEQRVKENLESQKVNFGYEDTKIPYTTEHTYTPDFTLYSEGKPRIYIEAKGRLDTENIRKLRCIKKQHPELDIRILFQKDNPIRKGSKTTYSKWAEKLGYICAVGEEVPKEWIKEL